MLGSRRPCSNKVCKKDRAQFITSIHAQARTSLEVLCVWGLDAAQQAALQDGWAALCGAVLECEDIEGGSTRVWIRCHFGRHVFRCCSR